MDVGNFWIKHRIVYIDHGISYDIMVEKIIANDGKLYIL